MPTQMGDLTIEEFTLDKARECDIVFLLTSASFSQTWSDKLAANGGPLVVDNSHKSPGMMYVVRDEKHHFLPNA